MTVDVDYAYFEELKLRKKPNKLNLCTKKHTGTSASAPIAAGLCALALEAKYAFDFSKLIIYYKTCNSKIVFIFLDLIL